MFCFFEKNPKCLRAWLITVIFLCYFSSASVFAQNEELENHARKILGYFRDFELAENLSLDSKENFHIEPGVSQDSKLGLKISVKPGALKDPKVLIEILANIKPISSEPLTHQALKQWAEIYWNSLNGDIEAKIHLKKWEKWALNLDRGQTRMLVEGVGLNLNYTELQKHLVDRAAQLQSEIQDLEVDAKKVRRQANKSWEQGEDLRKQLERAEEKLDDLIIKNDRKGVRRTIEAFLPWESMGPIEKNAWKQWLDAIENPSQDPNDFVLMFRGLDHENRLFTNSEGGHALMATVLQRNQGNYTRRLRSYRTNRERIGSKPGNVLDANLDGYGSISGSMKYHSGQANGTPYISFSNLDVAVRFSTSGTVAARVDKRRILPNFLNVHSEFEMLVPLIVFPDEIVHVSEFPSKIKPNNHSSIFQAEVEKKIGRTLSPDEVGFKYVDEFLKTKFKSQSLEKYLADFVRPYQAVTELDLRPPAHLSENTTNSNFGNNGNSGSKKSGFFGKMITGCKKLFSLLK